MVHDRPSSVGFPLMVSCLTNYLIISEGRLVYKSVFPFMVIVEYFMALTGVLMVS